MSWRNSRKGIAFVSATALFSAIAVSTALWQPEVTGQERSDAKPQTTVSEREAAPAIEHAKGLSLAFRRAAELATPSVVKIESHTKARTARSSRGKANGEVPFRGENPFKGTPFEDMFPEFGEFGGEGFRGRVPERNGVGAGVIIDSDCLVLTNNHVVQGADSVRVTLTDGREFVATDIKTDPQSDLAVLRLKDAKNLPAAKLGDSDELGIGDWVLAIGNPFELDTTVSAGIISGKGRELSRIRRTSFLQTDAAINPGNSGGPLVNLDGEVIGINTAIASSNGSYQGVGFAIPINLAKWVKTQLVERGSVERGYLGVQIGAVTNELAPELNVEPRHGVVVASVQPDSPAAKAGVQELDVITHFGDKKVNSPRELQELVERTNVGTTHEVRLLRDGREKTVRVTVQALPTDVAVADTDETEERSERPSRSEVHEDEKLGLAVANLTDEQASQFDGEKGVLVRSVEPESPAASEGIRPGMLIRKVGRTTVTNVDEYRKAVEKQLDEQGVLLSVRTSQGNRLVVVKPEQE